MNKTVKNSVIYFAGTVIMGILGLANTMILTRLLSQQVYAMYGLLNTFVTAVTTFIAFGYDSAYTRFYYKHGLTQKRFILKTLKIPLIVFSVLIVVLLEPNHFILKYIFEDDLSIFTIIILLIYIFFAFLHRFTQLTARMEEYAGNYVISNFVGKFGFAAVILAVFFVVSKVSFDWVILSFLISSAVATFINLYIFTKLTSEKNKNCIEVSDKELLSYGFPYMLNNVMVLVVPMVEKLIIRDLAGWNVLSVFTAAAVFQTIIMIISNTLINIWNPIVYKHFDNEEKFKPILHLFGLAAAIIITVGLALCVLLRRWLVILLDNNYYSVHTIAPVILFGACFNILNIIYSVGINIKKKTGYFVVSPMLQLGISVILCYALVPKMGLNGVAIATLASLVISKTYSILVGMKCYNSGTSEWKTVVLCVAGVAISVFTLFSTTLLSDIVVFGVLILLMIVVINKDFKSLFVYMKGLLKSSNKK